MEVLTSRHQEPLGRIDPLFRPGERKVKDAGRLHAHPVVEFDRVRQLQQRRGKEAIEEPGK